MEHEANLHGPRSVRERSELARHIRPSIFPAGRDDVVRSAVEEHAPQEMIDLLGTLPAGEFRNANDVWEALGGPSETTAHAHANGGGQDVPSPAPVGTRRFAFRFDHWYRLAVRPFGVTPAGAYVEVDADERTGELRARFGPWQVRTPLTNVVDATRTGPYSWSKTIGPPHLSLVDRGLTFATTSRAGLCIRFAEPVRGLEPTGVVRHRALTVTVEDVDALAGALGPYA
jgi:hypothetical protein